MLLDKDIREPLFEYLEERFGKVRIFEEKMIGRARADVVMVTEYGIYGIEIKSDADTYTRLKNQVKNYDMYYDYNYVVVGSTHASHVGEHIPQHWGIISIEEIDGQPDFYELRQPSLNPKLEMKRKLSILWRPELAHIQKLNNMFKYKDKSKDFVIDKILEKVNPEILNSQIYEELFERDYEAIAEVINNYRLENGRGKKRVNKVRKIKKHQRKIAR